MNRPPTPTVRLLDATEVAAMLGIPVRSVRRRAHDGSLPSVRVGRLFRFEPAQIDAWIVANRRAAS